MEELSPEKIAVLRLVALQYYARIPPRMKDFVWPNGEDLLEVQKNGVLVQALDLEAAGDETYKKPFVKELLHRMELAADVSSDEDLAFDDTLVEIAAHLVAEEDTNLESLPPMRHITHFFPLGSRPHLHTADPLFPRWDSIHLFEQTTTISHGTTGLKTWEASFRLGAHLLLHADDLYGKEVVELGCGTGFLGALVAKLCRGKNTKLTVTDVGDKVLGRTKDTFDLNGVAEEEAGVMELDWIDVQNTEPSVCPKIEKLRPEVVLAADVVFDPSLFPALCSVLKRLLQPHSNGKMPYALITTTVRNQETFRQFLKALDSNDLQRSDEELSNAYISLQDLKLADAGQVGLFPVAKGCSADIKLTKISLANNKQCTAEHDTLVSGRSS